MIRLLDHSVWSNSGYQSLYHTCIHGRPFLIQPVCPSVSITIHLFVFLAVTISYHLYFCLSCTLSFLSFLHLPLPFIFLSFFTCIHGRSFFISSVCQSVSITTHLFVFLSLSASISVHHHYFYMFVIICTELFLFPRLPVRAFPYRGNVP